MHCTAGYFRRKCPESGRPRMTEELQEMGLRVGHRRIGRLMRMNDIETVRTQKYKVTTIARQAIAKQSAESGTATMRSTSRPTCWIRIFLPMGQIKNGGITGVLRVCVLEIAPRAKAQQRTRKPRRRSLEYDALRGCELLEPWQCSR